MAMSRNALRNLNRAQAALTILVAVVSWTLFQVGLVDAGAALTIFFSAEIPMAVLMGGITIARFRRLRQELPKSLFGKLDAIATEEPLLRYPVSEIKLLVSVAKVIRRRAPDPSAFGYVKGTLTVPVAFAIVSLIELIVVHLLVPWQWLRILLLVGTVYGLFLLIGVFAARADNPHRVTSDSVVLNWGLDQVLDVPREAIRHVAIVSEHARTATEISGQTLVLAFMNSANVRIDLTAPRQVEKKCRIPVSGAPAPKGAGRGEEPTVTTVFLSIEEPQRFVEAVKRLVDAKTQICK